MRLPNPNGCNGALKAGKIEKADRSGRVHQRVMEITGDPLPYGIAPNRRVVEELIGHALTQGIIHKAVKAEELFAPERWTSRPEVEPLLLG
jgi:4,5-dihydroxyphthalate decarboxylase